MVSFFLKKKKDSKHRAKQKARNRDAKQKAKNRGAKQKGRSVKGCFTSFRDWFQISSTFTQYHSFCLIGFGYFGWSQFMLILLCHFIILTYERMRCENAEKTKGKKTKNRWFGKNVILRFTIISVFLVNLKPLYQSKSFPTIMWKPVKFTLIRSN